MAPIVTRIRRRAAAAEQAAAICYRASHSSVQFLLVNTSSGKWTFPKGRINPGMSAAESACQEAWEEAGAYGRIAERHVGYYADTKRGLGHDGASREIRIGAFLFEVETTAIPEENGRNPTWFSAREAKRQLEQGRSLEYARQITRIIDFALQHLEKHKHRGSSFLMTVPRQRLLAAR